MNLYNKFDQHMLLENIFRKFAYKQSRKMREKKSKIMHKVRFTYTDDIFFWQYF